MSPVATKSSVLSRLIILLGLAALLAGQFSSSSAEVGTSAPPYPPPNATAMPDTTVDTLIDTLFTR